ncbi:MAG: nodulation protein NfeD [Actinomycetota bacterium]|nr:nodulation protein NfeD [Actinomycetota bacterium]
MAARFVRFGIVAVVVAALLGPLASNGLAQNDPAATIDLVEVTGVIDQPTADYLQARLQGAQDDGVQAIVIQLDTPGGLDVAMREITEEMLNSSVPVIVWVAPRGARAASAGTFIAYAAHLAYMAEATEIGAATPVNLGGGDTLDSKVTSDAAAYIRALAQANERNAEWAEQAVTEAASLSADEAVDIGVVNGSASSLGDLLRILDGEEVEAADAGTVTLETWDEAAGTPTVTIRFQEMNLVQRLLHAVTRPDVAFLLLLVGMFGLIFELYNPGIGLAGIIGAVCLLLGFYALSVLPTNWVGVLLVVLAVVFFLVDVHTAGLGVWTVGGVAALITGALLLFSDAAPALRLDLWVIGAALFGTLVFFISVMTAALRVRLRRPITGQEGIIGQIAEARTDIAPEGTVFTNGTLWRARTMETGIAAGSKVEVKATEGLVLLVEPLHEHAQSSD